MSGANALVINFKGGRLLFRPSTEPGFAFALDFVENGFVSKTVNVCKQDEAILLDFLLERHDARRGAK